MAPMYILSGLVRPMIELAREAAAPSALPQAASETIRGLVHDSGAFGWVAIIVALFLIVYGGLLMALRPPRRAFILLGLLALIPPSIGALGTWMTRNGIQREVQAAEARGEVLAANDVAQHHNRADVPLKVGLVATAPVLVLVLMGLAFPRRGKEQEA